MKLMIKAGTTSKLADVFIQDSSSTTGAGLTGLTNASSGLTWYYYREGAASATQVTTIDTMTLGTWVTRGFIVVDGTNMPGCYQLGIPDAAIAAGAKSVIMLLKGVTNMAPLVLEIQLVAFDTEDAVHLGLSALPNTACTTNASLLTSGTGTDQLSVTSGRIDIGKALGTAVTLDANNVLNVSTKYLGGTLQTARDIGASVLLSAGAGAGQLDFTSGVVKANATQWLGGTIPAVNVTGVPLVDLKYTLGTISPATAGSVRADAVTGAVGSVTGAVGSVTGNVGGNVVGSVASVTGAVGSVTGNVGGNVTGTLGNLASGAKTDVENAVWNATLASHLAAGSTGLALNSAGAAGDPWSTLIPGAYGLGTAGHRLGNVPDLVAGAAGGLFIAGTNAPVTITGSGDALTISSTGTNGCGIKASGNGTGNGMCATGGATGHGMLLTGGASSGNGLQVTSVASDAMLVTAPGGSNGNAISLRGGGTGDGINIQGGSTGRGIHAIGGATSGAGIRIEGSATSGNGIEILTTSGDGLSITPTAGNGIVATANGTSKHGAIITGGTAGTSDGVKAVAGVGGVDIRGNITGNVTGNLSGSAGSVTGAVGSVTGAVGSVTGAVGSVTGNIGGTLANLAAGAKTDVENAVWNATLASHLSAGSTGLALNSAGAAGDPWSTLIPGAYGAGTAGHRLGNVPDLVAGAAGGLFIAGANADTTVNFLTGVTLTSGERNSVADALLDRAAGVETGMTLRQAARIMLSALAGKASGLATTTAKFRDTNDSKDRITATVDANGNRTAVTLNTA